LSDTKVGTFTQSLMDWAKGAVADSDQDEEGLEAHLSISVKEQIAQAMTSHSGRWPPEAQPTVY
jgi:hypothetical protein